MAVFGAEPVVYIDMANKPKKTRKTGKERGPKEERLVITEDPAVALSRLLNPPKKP